MGNVSQAAIGRLRWLGVLLVVLGIAAILTPAVAGNAVIVVIGCILVAAGVVPILRALKTSEKLEKILSLTLGIITALAGVAVIGHPLFGLAFLTLLLMGYFIVEGVWKIAVSFRYRPATGWVWLLLSGAGSLILGLFIWGQWPVSGMWAVGVLVGMNLLGTGRISLSTTRAT
jgi:uncharacterized membrane protein HdeD (DUF308 family)